MTALIPRALKLSQIRWQLALTCLGHVRGLPTGCRISTPSWPPQTVSTHEFAPPSHEQQAPPHESLPVNSVWFRIHHTSALMHDHWLSDVPSPRIASEHQDTSLCKHLTMATPSWPAARTRRDLPQMPQAGTSVIVSERLPHHKSTVHRDCNDCVSALYLPRGNVCG